MNDKLSNAVGRTVAQFQEHPTSFLSERDIQALLFVELRNATSDLRNQYDGGGKNARFGFTDPFCIHPVTTEYHLYNGKYDCFDVAVLSEEQDSKSDLWRQPCRIGIEIKLWQPGYGDCGYGSDVEKLQTYQAYLRKNVDNNRTFTGIAMLFIHPHVNAKARAAISDQVSGDPYPGDGVALHFVTGARHWWQQQVSAPPVPQVGA